MDQWDAKKNGGRERGKSSPLTVLELAELDLLESLGVGGLEAEGILKSGWW